jgi:hypothetical protein
MRREVEYQKQSLANPNRRGPKRTAWGTESTLRTQRIEWRRRFRAFYLF